MNSKARYTPGPWHAANSTWTFANREFIGIGNGAEHVGYASVTACVRLERAKANAQLIAAAPELVKALEDLELSATQARLASNVGSRKKNTYHKQADFLRGALDRLATEARAALRAAGVEE